MDERRLELKVGALALAALAGVLGLLWLMGELRLGRSEPLWVDFGHTGNVVEGAPVKLGGVVVGRVEEIRLEPERRDSRARPLPVKMGLSVEPRALAALRADAQVTVATVGPLGEPYLELDPGSADSPALPASTALRGTDAPRLDLVAQKLAAFLDAASGILDEDPEALRNMASSVSKLTRTLAVVLEENQGDVKVLTSEMAAAAKDMRELARLARTSMQPGGTGSRLLSDAAEAAALVKRDLPGLSGSASKALGGLGEVAGGLNAEDGANLRKALQSYAAAGEKLDQIAARADRLLVRLEAGEGTLGALQKDPQVYDDLRSLLADLRKHPWKILWKD